MLQRCKDNAIAKLNQHVSPEFVIVFGSFAKGTENDKSDLDLAYYAEKELSDYERFLVAGELSCACDIEVDLVDIRKIDTVFRAQIFFTGDLLYSRNEQLFYKERMRAGSMYVTLNEQRKEVLKSIQERGNVYGE